MGFYRTVIQVEVLSREPLSGGIGLEGIAREITEGDCSGSVKTISEHEVNGPEMARLLREQGSDPEFLGLTEDGREVEEGGE